MTSQEARFLEARQARAAIQRRSKRQSSSRHHSLHDFWISLQKDFAAWQWCLEELVKTQSLPITSSQQRKECADKLDVLLADLQSLRRKSLSSSAAAANDVPELPAADVRRLHQEFTAMATKLDEAREQLIPPTKFTFKRYRAAMKQREQQTSATTGEESDAANIHVQASSDSKEDRVSLSGHVIQLYQDAILVLNSDASLTIQAAGSEGGKSTVVGPPVTQSSSVLIRNLERCQLTISGCHKALRLQDVTDCCIRIDGPVDGAIHVSGCQRLMLYASCHQLRLHESNALDCHVAVGSGPILEDCTDIHLYATDKDDLVYDAKDFNWLRNGAPSPNFCVVEGSAESILGMCLEPAEEKEKVTTGPQSLSTGEVPSSSEYRDGSFAANVEECDDDDEDEL